MRSDPGSPQWSFWLKTAHRQIQYLRNALMTLLTMPHGADGPWTLDSLYSLFVDPRFRENFTRGLSDPILAAFWKHQWQADSRRGNDPSADAILSKLGAFLSYPSIRAIVSAPVSTIRPRQIMDAGDVLLVDLSGVGRDHMRLFGSLLIARYGVAALGCQCVPPSLRTPHTLYVDERKDGRWVAVQTLGFDADGHQLRRHFYGSSRSEVSRRLDDALRAQRSGMSPPDERRTVARHLADWLDAIRPTVRPSSFVRYEGDVRRWIVPSIGSIPLVRLGPTDIRLLLATCTRAGLSARSVSHVHATLRTANAAAFRDGQVIRNAAALVTAPREPKPRVRPIGPDDARAILVAVEGDRLAPLVAVTLGVGLRLGEALGLRWADVDLDAGTLAVRTALRRTPVEFREEGEPIYRLVAPKTDRSRRTIQLPGFTISRSLRNVGPKQRCGSPLDSGG